MHPEQRTGSSIWNLEKLSVKQEGQFWSAGLERASKLAQRLQVKANGLPPSNEQSNKSKMISFTVLYTLYPVVMASASDLEFDQLH